MEQNTQQINIAHLEPKVVWDYFHNICMIPRPSKKEDKIRNYLIQVAQNLNLKYTVTAIGNVIIQKSATPGMEICKKITMQVHMDMVTAKLPNIEHDFDNDPIQAYIDGQWVRANGTTLGADNGIGVAYGLAILAATNEEIKHGPLELLITTDEEMGMSGAFALQEKEISGEILLNLDSEEDNEVCIGCAGGVDTNITIPVKLEQYDKNDQIAFKIMLGGLFSGHSGIDIHLGRANAIKEIANLLYLLLKENCDVKLAHISGGRLRNVIPSYCEAVIVVSAVHKNKISSLVSNFAQDLQKEFVHTDSKLYLKAEELLEKNNMPEKVITLQQTKKIIMALNSCFNGLYKMNWELNIPYASSNLGVIKLVDDKIVVNTLQRCPDAKLKYKLAYMIGASFELVDGVVEYVNSYPGWNPNLESKALETVATRYETLFNEKIKVSATHGGLECGLILDKFPHMDAVSIGATIRDPHSPNERLNIASVAKIWELLKDLLYNISKG